MKISVFICLFSASSSYRYFRSPRRAVEPRELFINKVSHMFHFLIISDLSYIPLSASQSASLVSQTEGRNFILEKLCQLGLGEVSTIWLSSSCLKTIYHPLLLSTGEWNRCWMCLRVARLAQAQKDQVWVFCRQISTYLSLDLLEKFNIFWKCQQVVKMKIEWHWTWLCSCVYYFDSDINIYLPQSWEMTLVQIILNCNNRQGESWNNDFIRDDLQQLSYPEQWDLC